MRRFVTFVLSLSLVFGLSVAGRLSAQDEKKEAEKKADAGKTEAEQKPEPAPSTEAAAETEKPIPKDVQDKIDAARKAVAEAIVAAELAGLVDSSIDPPPILDILITGRANDAAVIRAKAEEVKAKTAQSPDAAVSLEVFGAWHTGNSKPIAGITAAENIRIIPPSMGLADWYRLRTSLFKPLIEDARKRLAPAATPEPKKEDEKKVEAPKDEPKKEDVKKDEAPKDEPKKEDEKKAEAPKDEPKKEDEKKAEAPKDEPKKEDEKKAEAPKDEPKKEDVKKDEAPK